METIPKMIFSTLRIINKLSSLFWEKKFRATNFKKIGINVKISNGFNIQSTEKLSIEDNVYIGPKGSLYAHGGIHIHSGTIIGPQVSIYSANHNFSISSTQIPYDKTLIEKPVIIHENNWIGGNVIIVPGVEIGEGCIVGAGSVVTKRIEKFSIVAGNPARVIGSRNAEHYHELKKQNQIYLINKGGFN